MECQEARRLLHALLDEDILQEDRSNLLEHLAGCIDCRAAQQSLEQTATLLREISFEQAPDDFAALLQSRLPKTHSSGSARLFKQLLITAAVLLVVLVSPLYFYQTINNPQLICQDRQVLIVQQDGQFVIPVDQVVRGNITVYRANLVVLGQIQGNVRLLDGELTLEGDGKVLGQVARQESSGPLRLKLAFAELWEDIGVWLFRR